VSNAVHPWWPSAPIWWLSRRRLERQGFDGQTQAHHLLAGGQPELVGSDGRDIGFLQIGVLGPQLLAVSLISVPEFRAMDRTLEVLKCGHHSSLPYWSGIAIREKKQSNTLAPS
jgi:hypothetical protein